MVYSKGVSKLREYSKRYAKGLFVTIALLLTAGISISHAAEGLWFIKAISPQGETLDVKAVDTDGNTLDVKAIETDGNTWLMDVNVSINSEGLRDKEYPAHKGDEYRIVSLGDSLTFGWGVEIEDTFQYILEEELNKTSPTEVINFGTGNYNTRQEVNLYFDKGLNYDSNIMS